MLETTEKTLNLDDARVFRVRTVLAVLQPDTVISVLNPVEVQGYDGVRLGWASVFVRGRELIADIVLPYASNERFSIETRSLSMFGTGRGVFEFLAAPWERTFLIFESQTEQLVHGHLASIEILPGPAYSGQPSLGEAVL